MKKPKKKYPLTHAIGDLVHHQMLCGRVGGKLWFAWDDMPKLVTCERCRAARRAGKKAV